tara:strand:- start:8099 stop:9760 length:1662 start_codon:yes stop_codon:yes gene_type:complete
MFKKIWKILNNKEKKLINLFVLFGIINVILELFSISALIPILTIFTNKQNLNIGGFEINYSDFSAISIEFYLTAFLIIFISRVIFDIFINYIKLNFSYNINNRLTELLFLNFFKKKIESFSKLNSAEIKRNLTNEIVFFSNTPVLIVNIITDVTIILGIIIFLLLTYFQFTMYILIASILFGVIYILIFKNRIKYYSQNKSSSDFERIKYLSHVVENFLDIRLRGKINYFKNYFLVNNKVYLNSIKKINIIRSFPKGYFEIIFSILLICYLVIIIKKNYLSNSDLLIQLGILIFAFSRISPLISKIIIYIQTLNFSQKSVDIINENLHINNELVKSDKSKIEFKNLIEVENINFQYENILIIKNLSFKIKKNSFNIIKGKSGSGKSTLANILLGELVPQQGKVLVDNVPIHDALHSWRKKISYISQNINLIDDSFIKNIAYGIPDQLIDKNKVVACAKISQINNFILEQKNQYETRVGEFGKLISQGQAQRIVIARALYSNTEFLILDEPTSSLDDENSKLFMEDLKKIKNITILMISHDQNLLKYAENVIDL